MNADCMNDSHTKKQDYDTAIPCMECLLQGGGRFISLDREVKILCSAGPCMCFHCCAKTYIGSGFFV